MKYRKEAISWMLHSLKILLGDESIRRYIILKYNPDITNKAKKCIRTFNAFVQKGKTRQDKAKKIIEYCDDMSKRKGIVVFTATNIQQDPLDNETHFQSYILDNNTKTIYIIDPAYDRNKPGNAGIYMAEVSNEVIIPFFKKKGYETVFVDLNTPAQVSEGDVFCQSWSLYILLQMLKKNEYHNNVSFQIPKSQIDKYDLLLRFYKQLFIDMPELGANLKTEYDAEILDARGPNSPTKAQKEEIIDINPVELLLSMKNSEMK
jgi:hypothetical protein